MMFKNSFPIKIEISLWIVFISKYSRNPAFLGFDLCYLGILIMFFNVVLLAFTAVAVVMMHMQILNEEKYLTRIYKEQYLEYKKQTSRYAGLGKLSLSKVILYVYAVLFAWCILYFFTCVIYSGPFLSMIWFWPGVAVFSAIRIKMLMADIRGESKIPKVATYIYRLIFVLAMGIFIYVESQVIQAMTAEPAEEKAAAMRPRTKRILTISGRNGVPVSGLMPVAR